TDIYLHLLDTIKKHKLSANVSIKLTQLGLTIDKKLAAKNAARIVSDARKKGFTVEIDMEGSRYTQETLDIYFGLIKRFDNVVQAVQAYLFRTEEDVRELLGRRGKIRLVKGGYKEPYTIAFKNKEDTDSNYVKLMKLFLQKGKYIAIATHDEKIISAAKTFIKKNRVPDKHFEFEMLYGIRPTLQEELAKEYPVRIYVPYGREWFPYYYRRIRERKENLYFALKNLLRN
ncbi:MAG: proline dehydrogenase family protein, partial [Patescibacteria group bacterium]